MKTYFLLCLVSLGAHLQLAAQQVLALQLAHNWQIVRAEPPFAKEEMDFKPFELELTPAGTVLLMVGDAKEPMLFYGGWQMLSPNSFQLGPAPGVVMMKLDTTVYNIEKLTQDTLILNRVAQDKPLRLTLTNSKSAAYTKGGAASALLCQKWQLASIWEGKKNIPLQDANSPFSTLEFTQGGSIVSVSMQGNINAKNQLGWSLEANTKTLVWIVEDAGEVSKLVLLKLTDEELRFKAPDKREYSFKRWQQP